LTGVVAISAKNENPAQCGESARIREETTRLATHRTFSHDAADNALRVFTKVSGFQSITAFLNQKRSKTNALNPLLTLLNANEFRFHSGHIGKTSGSLA
jgi:hypothetical protein